MSSFKLRLLRMKGLFVLHRCLEFPSFFVRYVSLTAVIAVLGTAALLTWYQIHLQTNSQQVELFLQVTVWNTWRKSEWVQVNILDATQRPCVIQGRGNTRKYSGYPIALWFMMFKLLKCKPEAKHPNSRTSSWKTTYPRVPGKVTQNKQKTENNNLGICDTCHPPYFFLTRVCIIILCVVLLCLKTHLNSMLKKKKTPYKND